ncbi:MULTISPECIES: response regulator transcription factor [Thermomonosporaceae]|uniref:response regulator transcription factor n=1 Tax=Thermomonosporaceae TaxID=2012 RepID=UPI00255ABB3E|nr:MULTISPECIES: response regulator transcription factor [Thermomonosporaceae]MDL4771867.1 response regulator transcription factor [Actinomadura xylanilytica]
MVRILVVEDDIEVRTALVRDLSERRHSVRSVAEAWKALQEVSAEPPEAVVLDLGLPDLDGFELLKMIRAISSAPVLVVTARDGEREIVRLLDAGADDYLVKPFTMGELEARLGAVLRRARGAGGDPTAFTVAGLRIDLVRHEAFLDGHALELSRREFDLLAYLAARPGEVVSRSELRAQVWRQPYGNDQTVDVHLSWLRRKLGETAAAPRYLHTVRGVGIRLEAPG